MTKLLCAVAASLSLTAARAGAVVAIPLAGDDARALEVAKLLVKDAGFEPVVVGPLAKARTFDVGTPVYTQVLTARELRERLGLPPDRCARKHRGPGLSA